MSARAIVPSRQGAPSMSKHATARKRVERVVSRRVHPRLSVEDAERLLQHIVLADPARPRTPAIAPFTGDELAAIPQGLPEDVELACEQARTAQPAWGARSA